MHLRSLEILYNPEFLREKFAEEDFVNSPMVILGGDQKDTAIVKDFYENHSICKTNNFIFTDLKSASLIKYSINSFLANKVIFSTDKEIFDHIESDIPWDEFTNIISIDKRIGSSHMMVPGHDGKLGFGGACFTKDTAALINYAQLINKNFDLLESTVKINNKIRSDYDDLDEREKEKQNVNYNFKISCPGGGNCRHKDLKSLEGDFVPVQVRPRVPTCNHFKIVYEIYN